MDQQQIEQVARQFIDALHGLERGDQGALDRMVELHSDEALVTNAMLRRAGQEHSGRAGAREFWEEYRGMFQDISSEFYQVTTNGEAAGLFWTSKGTDAAGRPIEYDGSSLLVCDDQGKIKLFRGYYDTRDLSRELGAG